MLNELQHLAQRLQQAGIATQPWHPKFKALPKYPAIRAYLNGDGRVARIDLPTPDELSSLRKWEPSNGESFPIFNIDPLHQLASSDASEQLKKEIQSSIKAGSVPQALAGRLNADGNGAWSGITAVEKCLARGKELFSLLPAPPPELSALFALSQLLPRLQAAQLHEDVSRLLVEALSAQPSALKSYEKVLLHIRSSDGKKETIGKATLLLDMSDAHHDYPVCHPKTVEWLNEALRATAGGGAEGAIPAKATNDVFGNDLAGSDLETFPAVNLPLIGPTILRAMNHESPCQFRYGKIKAEGCLVGQQSREQMQGGLDWLALPEHEEDTWVGIPQDDTLLFCYPDEPRQVRTGMAGYLGRPVENEGSFLARSAKLFSMLKGGEIQADMGLKVFVLTKRDRARRQVMASRNYSVGQVKEADQHWHDGLENLPVLTCFAEKKPDVGMQWLKPLPLLPQDVPRCLNTAWQLAEPKPTVLNIFTARDGLDLFFEPLGQSAPLSQHALEHALLNWRSVLLDMGQAIHSETIPKFSQKRDGLLIRKLPSVLGLLLFKTGIAKDDYMNQSHFMVGQLFGLADDLHRLYCEKVRSGQIPPRLLGNSLFAITLDDPARGLSLLAERTMIYLAWAQTYKDPSGTPEDKRKAGLAGYFLSQMRDISTRLAPLAFTGTPDAAQKAQLFLGYLAKSQKADTSLESN